MCDTIASITVDTDDSSFEITVSMNLSGRLIPATFHDDVDDSREIDVVDIAFEEGYYEYDTDEFKEKVYDYVNYFLPTIFKYAQSNYEINLFKHLEYKNASE